MFGRVSDTSEVTSCSSLCSLTHPYDTACMSQVLTVGEGAVKHCLIACQYVKGKQYIECEIPQTVCRQHR